MTPEAAGRVRLPGGRRLLTSSSFRHALAYSVLFTVSALVLLGFVYWSTTGLLWRQADETIVTEIEVLEERYRIAGLNGLTAVIDERLSRQPPGPSIYLLADAGRRPMRGNLTAWPAAEPDREGWLEFTLEALRDGSVRPARARSFRLRGGYLLLVGRDMHELQQFRTSVARTMVWGLAVTVTLALVGGAMIARGRLRRLQAIDGVLGRVMAGDLAQRVPEDDVDDDVGRLAAKLNTMLAELERLFDGVRRVSDDIAHDLRTPLTRLKNRLESIRRTRQADREDEEVERAIEEADRLLTTFSALLRIARVESGQRSGFSEVRLAPLFDDIAELYEPVFQDRGTELEVVREIEDPRVHGDRDLLFQAVVNLLENALRHAPGSAVRLAIEKGPGETVDVVVRDAGAGIPADRREQVKQRFFRLDASRKTPGSGLGLSLVSAIAELHRGSLMLGDGRPGLEARLRLPRG